MSGSDAVSAIRRWVEYNGWPSQPPELHVVTAYNIFSSRVHQNFWNQLKHAGVEQIAAGPKHESADRELEQRMRREFRLLPQSEAGRISARKEPFCASGTRSSGISHPRFTCSAKA